MWRGEGLEVVRESKGMAVMVVSPTTEEVPTKATMEAGEIGDV